MEQSNDTHSIKLDNKLDKFYTNPNIVDKCIKSLLSICPNLWNMFDLIIEPSVGSGNFYNKLGGHKIGIDISPDLPDATYKADYLSLSINDIKCEYFRRNQSNINNGILNIDNNAISNGILNLNIDDKILVIGNPPFGRVSSTAIKFFNHSAEFASAIAFIIPKTFRRISVQNKLNKKFHLIFDEDIPDKPCSFTPKMSVKCCFQVWVNPARNNKNDFANNIIDNLNIERPPIILKTEHTDWQFLAFGENDKYGQPTPPSNADFVILAYGGKCGRIVKDKLGELRPKSWHWIKSNINADELIARFNSLDYSVSKNTARQNSIGRGELVMLYEERFNE